MSPVSPESVGMSSERLARIDTVMENFVKNNQMPGISTLVYRRGQLVHQGQYGLMNIEANKPMHDDVIFRLYSMTKPITSIALMMLYEHGLFSLSDPISDYIPAFKDVKVYERADVAGARLVPPNQPITIHHLLTHTAGLSYGFFFDHPVEDLYRQENINWFKRDGLLETSINELARLPLLFHPGTHWRYSHATDVLGYLVEILSDMPLDNFFHDNIFKPLGMIDTDFFVPAEKTHRLAELYQSEALYNPIRVPLEHTYRIGDITQPTTAAIGGSGLVSTITDYAVFCTALLNETAYDGGRLLSPKTFRWMTTNHVAHLMPLHLGNERDFGFGLGFSVTTDLGFMRTLGSVGMFGWSGAAQTDFWIDPSEELFGLFMTQYLPMLPYPAQKRFQILVYQAIMA